MIDEHVMISAVKVYKTIVGKLLPMWAKEHVHTL